MRCIKREPENMSAIHLFNPADKPGASTVSDIVGAFVEDLALLVQAGEMSGEAFANIRRDLLDGGKSGKPISLCQLQVQANDKMVAMGAASYTVLSQQILTKWLLANPQWRSLHKQKGAVGAVMRALKWAEDTGLIDRSPIRVRPPLLNRKAQARREADPAEYIAFMRHGSRELRRALYFLWNTGARPAEMRCLKQTEIFWEDSVIDTAKNKTGKATGETRVIGLEPRMLRFLRNVCNRRTGEFVFLNCYGTQWDRHTFARHLRRTAKRIGLDEGVEKRVSSYCLRHTYITDADEAGVDSRRISFQSGHSGTKMIEWYSKARRKRRNTRKVAREIGRKRRQLRKDPEAFGESD